MPGSLLIPATETALESQETTFGPTEARYSYRSDLINQLRESGYELHAGRVTIRLAQKFGFCWGVDRAVAMVWDTVARFPGRRIWLLNQIIHNPQVNEDFLTHGVKFIFGRYAGEPGFAQISRDDVVIIPAFSAEVEHLERLRTIGCEIVDTTCPWVEKPHRRVQRYLDEGFTVIIHGVRGHDETRATCSLVESQKGRYLVLRDLEETQLLCDYLLGKLDDEAMRDRFESAWSRGFVPHRDLLRLGLVNQTTMLASESREVARMIREALQERDAERSKETFRDFDTICPATQDNQDAVTELTHPVEADVFIVLGGYDSSNTGNLLRAAKVRHGAYHVQTPSSIQPAAISHRDPVSGEEKTTTGWLPAGRVVVALSAGASTPDTELAEVVHHVCRAGA